MLLVAVKPLFDGAGREHSSSSAGLARPAIEKRSLAGSGGPRYEVFHIDRRDIARSGVRERRRASAVISVDDFEGADYGSRTRQGHDG